MKKRIACLLTLVMVLQLAACAQAPTPSVPETGLSQTETEESAGPEKDGDADTDTDTDEDGLPAVGEELSGFTLKSVESYGPLNARILCFTHEQSGARLCYIKNDDTNRSFSIAYRTPHVNETDANHIFEHAIVASFKKYPSKDLFFDLAGSPALYAL